MNLPKAFENDMRALLGAESEAFFQALDAPAALALRLNPKRPDAERFARSYFDAPVPWESRGRILKPGAKPGADIAHFAGAYYLQEASAMASAAAAAACAGLAGQRVLDLCAAPGGKSTQLAAAMGDRGLLVSNDPEPGRAKILHANLERMGVSNAVVLSALPERLAPLFPAFFDVILVDAPCSGEGMFRREPEALLQWNPAAPQGCARRQAGILDCAAQMLRPGGQLFYSTCTFNALENEGTVKDFLARHADFLPADFTLPGVSASHDGMLRLFPHCVRGDGHFVARLCKSESAAEASKSLPKTRRENPRLRPDPRVPALLSALEAEVCRLPDALRSQTPFIAGDRLHIRPGDCPDLSGIKIVSPGLCLARIGRNHLEPDHALAMAISPGDALRQIDLSDDQARQWLRGEALPMAGDRGWTLVTWQSMPLGWGKLSDGILKNHLPKGLRRN